MVLGRLSLKEGGMDAISGAEDVGSWDALKAKEESVFKFEAFLGDLISKLARALSFNCNDFLAGPVVLGPSTIIEEDAADSLLGQSFDKANQITLGSARWRISTAGKDDLHR